MQIVPSPPPHQAKAYQQTSVENNLTLVWYFSIMALIGFGVHLLHHLRLGNEAFSEQMMPYLLVYISNVLYALLNLFLLPYARGMSRTSWRVTLLELMYPTFLAFMATVLSIYTSIQGHGPVPFIMGMMVIAMLVQGHLVFLFCLLFLCWMTVSLGLLNELPMQDASSPILTCFTSMLIAMFIARLAERSRVDQFEILHELHEKNSLLEELSVQDPLTKLNNRRYFASKLESETTRSLRYQHPLGLLIVDVDDFKKINDSDGHLVGDEVLIEIARLISQQLRSDDIVCRLGGDEFVILLVEAEVEQSKEIATRICDSINANKFARASHKVTVSIGYAQYTGQPLGDFMQQADKMMYTSKKRGKNQVAFFGYDFDSQSVEL
ncbi:GGDEF domain-containing protein [Paraglaciecola sp. 20A4]|uniref:GGDEF domain-containing protein n=1 Tax=Paraglaciecola sp. 20A4 TaxID=2687288 RepID=UPI0014085B10|nr:GGDEF domain-containing protein [Paraglaciecola sp. 20A4]